MHRIGLTMVVVLLIGTAAMAADPPTKFAGFYEFSTLSKPGRATTTSVVREPKAWATLLASLPTRVPGKSTRLDAPNSDPVLSAKIDWDRQMVVVVRSRVAVPTIVRAGVDGKSSEVVYRLEDDLSAHPANWGSYAAWIVPRRAKVRFSQPAAEGGQPAERSQRE